MYLQASQPPQQTATDPLETCLLSVLLFILWSLKLKHIQLENKESKRTVFDVCSVEENITTYLVLPAPSVPVFP